MENLPHSPGDTFHPSTAESVTPTSQQLENPPKKKSKKPLVVVSVLVTIIIIGLLVWKVLVPNLQFREATSKANQFIDHIAANDTQAAYSETSSNYQNKVSQQQLQQLLDADAIKGIDKDNINLASRQDTGDNPNKVEFKYVFSHNGKEYFIKLIAVEQDGEWLVDDAVLGADIDGFQRNNTGN